MHIELRVLLHLHASLLDCVDSLAVTVTLRPMRRGQDNLNTHSTLCCIHQRLFDSVVVHLFCLDEKRMMGAANQGVKVVARIDGADDKVGIVELRRCMVPVGIEDGDYCLHILAFVSMI